MLEAITDPKLVLPVLESINKRRLVLHLNEQIHNIIQELNGDGIEDSLLPMEEYLTHLAARIEKIVLPTYCISVYNCISELEVSIKNDDGSGEPIILTIKHTIEDEESMA